MSETYTCSQCGGKGCAWCHHIGRMFLDRYRECAEENRKADADRNWSRDRYERSGAHRG